MTSRDYINFGRRYLDAFVLDASLAAAWCFPDEQTPYTEFVLEAVSRVPVFAPRLWAHEVRNSVSISVRRKRITGLQAQQFPAFLDLAPVRLVDPLLFRHVFDLAERHALTIYDAACLDVALRQGLKLATLDRPKKSPRPCRRSAALARARG